MVRIYASIEYLDNFYTSQGASRISLVPFDIDCYYLDLDLKSDTIYNIISYEDQPFDWKPYNVEEYTDLLLYNPNTKDIIKIIDKFEGDDGNLIYQLPNYDEVDSSNYPDYLCLSDYDLVYKKGVLVEMKPC